MHIREAAEADLDLICRLRLAFLADHRGVPPEALPPELTTATRAFIAARHRAAGLWSWLAEDDGRCVGLVSMLLLDMPPRPDDLRTQEGYVINMYVEPAVRHRGIGGSLFRACLAGASTLGVRRLLLHATDDGRPLYERAGFAPNDRWMELPR